MLRALIPFLFIAIALPALAQTDEQAWDEFSEAHLNAAEEEEDGLYDRLQELHNNPIDINRATREDLLLLPFLGEEQVDSLLAYRERKHGLLSFGELQFISRLSYYDRRFIPLFFDCRQPEKKDTTSLGAMLWKGRHTLVTRFDIPLYRREGFKSKKKSTHYFGLPFSNVVRYRYAYKDCIAYGVTLQQDEGEPFAKAKNYPYDYMSFYFNARFADDRGEFLIGDYKLSTGQGLLFGNNFFASRLYGIERPFSESRVFTKSTSTDETRFFRGAAAKWRTDKWQFAAFLSYRRLDATIKNDTITSFVTTGYHRTLNEHAKKWNAGEFLTGANARRHFGNWSLGLTTFFSRYTHTICPTPRPYNRHYLRGRNAGGISADYSLRTKRWDVQGEIASDAHLHFASTHTAWFRPRSEAFTLMTQLRTLGTRFISPHASTITASSRTSNEHALLTGMNLHLLPRTDIAFYAEGCLFPRPTYNASQRSCAYEFCAQLRHRFSGTANEGSWSLTAQYRVKGRQQDVKGIDAVLLEFQHTNRAKLSLEYAGQRLNFLAALNGNVITNQTGYRAKGWSISARTRYAASKRLNFSAHLAYFDTDDYATRIYVYEPQLRFTAGFPTLYYNGFRGVALLQWKATDWGEIACRYGITHYFDRSTISSGAQLIRSATKQDLSIHMMLRF